MTTAKDIWFKLEKHFSVTNGSRKYRLNRDFYDLKQHSLSINDYYTAMKVTWEELDDVNVFFLLCPLSLMRFKLSLNVFTNKGRKPSFFKF